MIDPDLRYLACITIILAPSRPIIYNWVNRFDNVDLGHVPYKIRKLCSFKGDMGKYNPRPMDKV